MSERERIEQEITGGAYGPGVTDVPHTYRPENGADDDGLSSTVPADTDVERLRDGGPQEADPVMTTTGGTAGPNSVRRPANHGPGVAPTTTGDAGTGGFDTGDGAA